jgi:hypothetical protein
MSTVEAKLQAAYEQCRDTDGPINERLTAYAVALKAINPGFRRRRGAADCAAARQ